MSGRRCGKIVVKGIVQGVGFRPHVYACAEKYGIRGTVQNLGSEVRITAYGDKFEEFLAAVSKGTVLSKIDSVDVFEIESALEPQGFTIIPSGSEVSSMTGFIPPDIAICPDCIKDIFTKGGRYEGYWATSCVNCGPRYSIINAVPYDRERTAMDEFPMCQGCEAEYTSPASRRHHAQTIACEKCGPGLALYDNDGKLIECPDIIGKTAELLDDGYIVAIKGIGGFHIACIESSARRLKEALGRTEQALAIMAVEETVDEIAYVSDAEREILNGVEHPITVLRKRDPKSHCEISNLNTIGCMLPYTGLHHLIFSKLKNRILIMTSANAPGNPMITKLETALVKLGGCVDYYLNHDRVIQNRCDDSVVRDGFLIRIARGYAPKRMRIDLGSDCILGTGPELYTTASIYKNGFCFTSPHVGNIKNPQTLEYLIDTADNLKRLCGADINLIAHDMHPQFLSTRYAVKLSEETGAGLFEVQHHRAHIAAAFSKYAALDPERECIGLALDGVGLGDDGTVWGGEIFAGALTELKRAGHLSSVRMPGGDLATVHPERMLYAFLPEADTRELLMKKGWSALELNIIDKQLSGGFNAPYSSSAGRVLDAASALLGICNERTYDGEPAMKLESVGAEGTPEKWDIERRTDGGMDVLVTSDIIRHAFDAFKDGKKTADIAASVQYNLAAGFAEIGADKADEFGIRDVCISGGVFINHTIRETVRKIITERGLNFIANPEYPFGDGCISYGQCVYAGISRRLGK